MANSRVDSDKFKAAIKTAETKLSESLKALEPFMVMLNEDDRRYILRPRSGFVNIARKIESILSEHPEIGKTVDVTSDALTEDLNNLDAMTVIFEKVERLTQMLADTKLKWTAEAYHQALPVYHVAKLRAKSDGQMANRLEEIAEFFSTKRGNRKSKSPEKPA